MARSFCEVCRFSCSIDKITGKKNSKKATGAGGWGHSACLPNTQEAEAGRSLSSRPAWSSE